MATNLKLKKKCHIVAPEWLTVGKFTSGLPKLTSITRTLCLDFLQERLTRETTIPEFSQLPFRFTEIAKIILDVCASTLLCGCFAK
jgi:GINS complex subunit 2